MPTLWAARGGNTNSFIYTVNPLSGVMASVGGPTGFAITGLAFDPSDGSLYGATSNQSVSSPRSLISINTVSGIGTLIGAFGVVIADIAFSPAGQLYGWVEGPDDLFTINKLTGATSSVGNAGINTFGDGMDFTSSGVLWLCPEGAENGVSHLYTVNPTTGVATQQSVITNGPFTDTPPVAAASFSAMDDFYVVLNDFTACRLAIINVSTGVITDIGSMLVFSDALAWDRAAGSAFGFVFDGAPLHHVFP